MDVNCACNVIIILLWRHCFADVSKVSSRQADRCSIIKYTHGSWGGVKVQVSDVSVMRDSPATTLWSE